MQKKFSQLGKDSLIYGLGSVVSRIIGFFLLPIYTRIFSTADYGVIDVISTTITLFTILLSGSMVGTALSYYFYSTDDENDRLVSVTTNFVYLVLANSVIGVLAWIFVADISDFLFQSQEYIPYLKLSILTLPFAVTNHLNVNLFRLSFKRWRYLALTLANILVTMTMNIVLIVVLRIGLIGVYWTNLIATVLFALIGLWMNRTLFGSVVSWKRMKGMLVYAVPLIPGSISMWAINSADRLFLTRYAGLNDVGLYATGAKIGSAIVIVTSAFQTANAPHQFAISLEEGAKDFYASTLKYYLLFFSFLGIINSIFAREVIELLTPQEYWTAYYVVPFLVFSAIAYGLYQVLGVGLLLAKKTAIWGQIIFIAGFVHVGLLLFFLPLWGYLGAGFVTLVTHIGVVLVLYVYSQKEYPVSYSAKDALLLTLVTAVIIVIGIFVDLDNIFLRLLVKLVLLLLYPLILVKLSVTSWGKMRLILTTIINMLPASISAVLMTILPFLKLETESETSSHSNDVKR